MFKQVKPKSFLLVFSLLLPLVVVLYPVIAHALPHSLDMTAAVAADCRELVPGKCKIIDYLQLFIRVLSGLVGVIIVIMLAVRGIQYSSARENPQMVHSAKMGIFNTVMALLFYLFTFAFLQWLVPGGVI